MQKEVRLPQFGMTMETAQVVRWLKGEDDKVEKGEPLIELLNDKATVEFESPHAGYLRILASEGEELHIGDLLALIVDSPDE